MSETPQAPEVVPAGHRNKRLSAWLSAVLLALSLGLLAFSAYCYVVRPDTCAAFTLFPVWVWVAPGLLLGLLGAGRNKRTARQVVLLWSIFLVVLAEEPRSLARNLLPYERSTGGIRVVSLNCAGGSAEAAAEVAQYHPDIVLLQEAPGQSAVHALAKRLFGKQAAVVWGLDPTIIARGTVLSITPDLPNDDKTARKMIARSAYGVNLVQARVRLATGPEIEIASLRLLPPLARFDLWSGECWREQTENRRLRCAQLQDIAQRLKAVPPQLPIIAGGDFNAPAGDAVTRLLQPRLHDAFADDGRGWGDTATNDYPVQRIDQIWLSTQLRAVNVVARKTQYSDHRMVVCDVMELSRR